MKDKSIKVIIEEPCHESWKGMTPDNEGRFCGSCAKSVIDFSNMSDIRLTEFLKKNQGQNMCGRFTDDQLNRVLTQSLPVQKTYYLRTVLFGAAVTSLFGLESCKSASRTTGAYAVYEQKDIESDQNLTAMSDSERIYEGSVIDKQTLVGISKTTLRFYTADNVEIDDFKTKNHGSFKITLHTNLVPSYVLISADGYKQRKIMVSDLKGEIYLNTAKAVKMGKMKVL